MMKGVKKVRRSRSTKHCVASYRQRLQCEKTWYLQQQERTGGNTIHTKQHLEFAKAIDWQRKIFDTKGKEPDQDQEVLRDIVVVEIQELAINVIFKKVEMHHNLGVFLSMHVSIQSKEKDNLLLSSHKWLSSQRLRRVFQRRCSIMLVLPSLSR